MMLRTYRPLYGGTQQTYYYSFKAKQWRVNWSIHFTNADAPLVSAIKRIFATTFGFKCTRNFHFTLKENTPKQGEERVMSEALTRDYQVCEEIGRGRFGTVYRCVSVESGDSFACKSIDKLVLADDSTDRQCIDREAKMTQLSGHPNVVKIFDVYEDDTRLDIILELCSSSDLFDRIAHRVFSEAEAAAVMKPLMEALAHCHRRGVAHRDIKPDNVFFDEWNRLKLGDFGSAECFREGDLMSGIVGTPYYVAPEVVAGRLYSEKVDVWSAGVILYIMLAGIPPFYGESSMEIFEAVVRANLRFPTRLFRSVSPAAKDLLRRMICKDVSRRFTAEQVLRHPWMVSAGETGTEADE